MKKEVVLQNRIAEFCRQKELLKRGDRILLGLSGGADSVCLFLVLSELAKFWELALVPVHVNHNLRGEEAMQDAVNRHPVGAEITCLVNPENPSESVISREIYFPMLIIGFIPLLFFTVGFIVLIFAIKNIFQTVKGVKKDGN